MAFKAEVRSVAGEATVPAVQSIREDRIDINSGDEMGAEESSGELIGLFNPCGEAWVLRVDIGLKGKEDVFRAVGCDPEVCGAVGVEF